MNLLKLLHKTTHADTSKKERTPLSRSDKIGLATAVIALPGMLAASLAVANHFGFPPFPSPENQTQHIGSTTIGSRNPQSPTSSSDAETSPTKELSGCYDGDTPTPCGSPHSREVFSKPAGVSCDETSLILYMGGVAGVDLLGSGIDVTFFKNADDLCVVERTSGMPNVSLKDIWTVDNDHNGYKDGGDFRRCFNRQGQPTSCDTDHASEEFFDAPTDVDCGKKYEEFSGRPVDRSIRVSQSSSRGNIVCRAEVQVSTDRLTASVRNLENASLPIKQG
ncbi:hypothetical protein [uncultured Actinomyces sp.]|jgi:hypothetical protein|uniref:hypothetical protein n=1 Tax=uncultured Actinomyces sp. TaxID=249061 RepID=UPI0028D64FA7|nr:hypothetical protein [uncultured Actinomyces sp.]